jgi:hypothetical protein
MAPEAPFVMLRPSLAKMRRTYRWDSLVFVVGPGLAGLVGALRLSMHPSGRSRLGDRELIAFGVTLYFWLIVAAVVWVTLLRRLGYYASTSEVGHLTLSGARRPTKVPVARWIRKSAGNPVARWRSMRYVCGIDARGHLVFLLAMAVLSDSEVTQFLEHTGLPVEGDWADRSSLRKLLAAFPAAPEQRPTSPRRWLVVAGGFLVLAVFVLSFIVALGVARGWS